MTCTGGWEGKEKLQKPLGDVYPSHPIPSNLSLRVKNPQAAREFCLELLLDLLGSVILWENKILQDIRNNRWLPGTVQGWLLGVWKSHFVSGAAWRFHLSQICSGCCTPWETWAKFDGTNVLLSTLLSWFTSGGWGVCCFVVIVGFFSHNFYIQLFIQD